MFAPKKQTISLEQLPGKGPAKPGGLCMEEFRKLAKFF